ncbi:alpha/beta fold hydrolase [Bacillus cereus]|uniref:alpha/beta fold hydrolase n=1 Tax=Bacillus cereus TaxID=1396 RepID=UPI00403A6A7B
MFVTVEKDVHIFVQDVNPGPGSKTVFFVHGWPLNHQMYQYQLNVLPEHGFRCIAMDIRGNGQSDKPWTGYTYDRLADDIAIVLEALQVENATLVGFSVGGALSIRYMSRYNGRRISKLALIDAVSPSFVKNQESPYGVTKDLNKINVPTKIFHGVHDQLIPYKSAELTQQRIKNSQLHALTNSGHGSPIDQADELNKELIKFLHA